VVQILGSIIVLSGHLHPP